jgi:urease accessory protein
MAMQPLDHAAPGVTPSRVLLALAMSCPVLAWAHPGHDQGAFLPGLLHALHGWDHVLAAVAVGVWAARLRGRALWALPLAFVGAMAFGIGLAAAGWPLPLIEPAIAASLLTLGVLVAADARFTAATGALLVGVFAPFHGAAHVGEAAATASSLAYAGGLLLSTALLHATGIAAAVLARGRPRALRLAAVPMALAGLCWLAAPALGH